MKDDIDQDARGDTAFLFCLVRLPFQNAHHCSLGDYLTGFIGADEIHFLHVNNSFDDIRQRSSATLRFQPTIYFRFQYPKGDDFK